ncbi:MAG: flagellar type III secretion system pore protein FliP [Rickettsiales bacterium]
MRKGALLFAFLALLLFSPCAFAQKFTLDFGGKNAEASFSDADKSADAPETNFSGRIVQIVVLVTALGLAPTMLVTLTCFTRLAVVFSILRTALGLQQSPPNPVMVGLALFLTYFIMQPYLNEAYDVGVRPYAENKIPADEAAKRAIAPVKRFMRGQTRQDDLALFVNFSIKRDQELTDDEIKALDDNPPLHVLAPAFMISELKRAFEIGFLLYLPFLIIDMVVAATLMSMGMMMLPPVLISLPFKLIFFVLIDGWHMLVGSLMQGYS